jgi:protein involved in polysaccharide export with SLBB domain
MIKKQAFALFVLFALVSFVTPASAQMSDEAVISYVKSGVASGKSQDQLIKELSLRGVDKEQALRIKNKLGGKDSGSNTEVDKEQTASRMRTSQSVKTAPTKAPAVKQPETDESQVFGRNIFSIKSLSFAPLENIATPADYKLGPGDEVIIDVWGTNQATIRQIISPDGFINIEEIGLVYLGGMTIKEADDYVRHKLSQIYSVGSEDAQSEVKLTLGIIRTITVNVMGEVVAPGTYSLSSLSTIYHALYRAGGFSDLGSVRNVSLVRNGKKIADIDIYDFIIKGEPAEDVILQDGDIVLVPTYESVVTVAGNVKRPMKYEMKEGETITDLVEFFGGFQGDAYTANITVVRRNGREHQIYTVENAEFPSFGLLDGDSVNIGTINDRYENRVEVKGPVYRPGFYQLSDKVNTITELIAVADGLRGDAFTNRALLHREREDYTLELITVDLKGILNGTVADIELQKNDVLTISNKNEINRLGAFSIVGEVFSPGTYRFAQNTTLEDLILQAGGLLESASTAKVDVSRRVKDPESMEETDTICQTFTFSIDSEFKVIGGDSFVLEPYDQIYVRRSPGYSTQLHVQIKGEVTFPGTHVLTNKTMRLSDVIKSSGGTTSNAYIRGAKLYRRMNEEERKRLEAAINVLDNAEDPEKTQTEIETINTYTIGVNLEEALANPGSDADLVLREGDIIVVPEYTNTVKISGCVLYPNTVTYNPKMTVGDYITQGGGYGFRAKKRQAYVVYMNGTVSKARRSSRKVVEPGCEIIVPNRPKNEESLANILSIASTSASVATMLGTVYNLIK